MNKIVDQIDFFFVIKYKIGALQSIGLVDMMP